MGDDQQVLLGRALLSLEGLSVGDALGQRFFSRGLHAPSMIARREVPPRRWDYQGTSPLHVDAHAYAEADLLWQPRREATQTNELNALIQGAGVLL